MLLLSIGDVLSDQEVGELLSGMEDNMGKVNYEGNLVFSCDSNKQITNRKPCEHETNSILPSKYAISVLLLHDQLIQTGSQEV